MSDPERALLLEDFIKKDLVYLWDNLFEARDRARNGVWSMECDCLITRIKQAMDLVGPVNYENIGMNYLMTGEFQQIVEQYGLSKIQPVPTNEERKLYRELMKS